MTYSVNTTAKTEQNKVPFKKSQVYFRINCCSVNKIELINNIIVTQTYIFTVSFSFPARLFIKEYLQFRYLQLEHCILHDIILIVFELCFESMQNKLQVHLCLSFKTSSLRSLLLKKFRYFHLPLHLCSYLNNIIINWTIYRNHVMFLLVFGL